MEKFFVNEYDMWMNSRKIQIDLEIEVISQWRNPLIFFKLLDYKYNKKWWKLHFSNNI